MLDRLEGTLEEMNPEITFLQVYKDTTNPSYLTIEAREIKDDVIFVKFSVWLHEAPHWALTRIIKETLFSIRLDQPQATELLLQAKSDLQNKLRDITRYLEREDENV